MVITDYTTFDEVRAALGISDEELEDSQIDLPLYANVLRIELEDIHVNVPTLYATIKGQSSTTQDEERFLEAAHLFATYCVAKQVSTALQLLSPEQVTDGKAMFRRSQADTPYQKVIDAVGRQHSRFRDRLSQLFAIVNSSAPSNRVAKIYLSVVSPGADPVTGG